MNTLHERMVARLPKAAADRRWYEIKNQAGPVATIRIYDEIGYWGITADDFARELEAVTAAEIEVQINSPGGEVFAGVAIYNALRTHPARVTTRVDGIAASIASVIAQAGDHRVMVESAQMMIHEAWGLAVGSAADMREMADLLDRQCDVLAGIYANRSGRPVDECRERMRGESWLTDQETLDAGLADEIMRPARQPEDPAALTESRVRALIAEATDGLRTPPLPARDEDPVSDPLDEGTTTALRAMLDALSPEEEN